MVKKLVAKLIESSKSIYDEEEKNEMIPQVGTYHNGNANLYMAHKIAKLKDLHQLNKNELKSNIFKGCIIFINGYTNPPIEELRRLIHIHGGETIAYRAIKITHLVCNNFTDAQLKSEYSKIKLNAKNKIYNVTSNWILESIENLKRLDENLYLPAGFINRYGTDISKLFKTNLNDNTTYPRMISNNDNNSYSHTMKNGIGIGIASIDNTHNNLIKEDSYERSLDIFINNDVKIRNDINNIVYNDSIRNNNSNNNSINNNSSNGHINKKSTDSHTNNNSTNIHINNNSTISTTNNTTNNNNSNNNNSIINIINSNNNYYISSSQEEFLNSLPSEMAGEVLEQIIEMNRTNKCMIENKNNNNNNNNNNNICFNNNRYINNNNNNNNNVNSNSYINDHNNNNSHLFNDLNINCRNHESETSNLSIAIDPYIAYQDNVNLSNENITYIDMINTIDYHSYINNNNSSSCSCCKQFDSICHNDNESYNEVVLIEDLNKDEIESIQRKDNLESMINCIHYTYNKPNHNRLIYTYMRSYIEMLISCDSYTTYKQVRNSFDTNTLDNYDIINTSSIIYKQPSITLYQLLIDYGVWLIYTHQYEQVSLFVNFVSKSCDCIAVEINLNSNITTVHNNDNNTNTIGIKRSYNSTKEMDSCLNISISGYNNNNNNNSCNNNNINNNCIKNVTNHSNNNMIHNNSCTVTNNNEITDIRDKNKFVSIQWKKLAIDIKICINKALKQLVGAIL